LKSTALRRSPGKLAREAARTAFARVCDFRKLRGCEKRQVSMSRLDDRSKDKPRSEKPAVHDEFSEFYAVG